MFVWMSSRRVLLRVVSEFLPTFSSHYNRLHTGVGVVLTSIETTEDDVICNTLIMLLGWALFRGAHSWTVPWPPCSSVPPGWYPQNSRDFFLTFSEHTFLLETVYNYSVGRKEKIRKKRTTRF